MGIYTRLIFQMRTTFNFISSFKNTFSIDSPIKMTISTIALETENWMAFHIHTLQRLIQRAILSLYYHLKAIEVFHVYKNVIGYYVGCSPMHLTVSYQTNNFSVCLYFARTEWAYKSFLKVRKSDRKQKLVLMTQTLFAALPFRKSL